jgi:flagellar motor switch protein FliN/FliY
MMSDGALSQDEINALLSGGAAAGSAGASGNPFTSDQIDKIKELFAAAADTLGKTMSSMAGIEVSVALQDVIISNKEEIMPKFADTVLDVTVNFTGDINGGHYFVTNEADALKFGSSMVGQPLTELDGAATSAFSELFSQFTGNIVTSISAAMGKNFSLSTPNAQSVTKGLSRIPSSYFVALEYVVSYEENSFPLYEILDEFVMAALTQPDSDLPQAQPMPEPTVTVNNTAQSNGGGMGSFSDAGSSSGGGRSDVSQSSSPMYNSQTPNVQGVQLPNLTPGNPATETRNISLLMDVMMELTVELGRTRWQIKDILGLGEGTIIELDKLAGEPVDILVNHNLIARGEVVVIDENFGVRVTEIISSMDKIAGNR